jgi:O-antigen/teichoic acid export membrane protein
VLTAGALQLAVKAGWLPSHSVYAAPAIPSLVALVSAYAIVSGFESTKIWVARRHLSLATVTKLEVVCQLATTLFQIAWAIVAPSVWTLAGGWIFGSLVRTVLSHLWLPGPPNRFQWDAGTFREIFDFGKWVTLSSAFSFLLTGGDTLLLGGLLDANLMGAYAIAVMLLSPIRVAVLRLTSFVVLPALGEVFRETPERLKSTIYRVRWPLDIACLMAAGALWALGGSVVRLLYDSRYESAGWMLTAVSFTLIATRLSVFDQCLVAMGRVKLLGALNAIRLVALYCAIPLGYQVGGAVGAVYGVAASALVNAAAMLLAQARVGLLDLKRELLAFPLYAGGVAMGWALLTLMDVWKAF